MPRGYLLFFVATACTLFFAFAPQAGYAAFSRAGGCIFLFRAEKILLSRAETLFTASRAENRVFFRAGGYIFYFRA